MDGVRKAFKDLAYALKRTWRLEQIYWYARKYTRVSDQAVDLRSRLNRYVDAYNRDYGDSIGRF